MNEALWIRVFCSYTRDYVAIGEWLLDVEEMGPEETIRQAKKLVETRGRPPDAITLGFSPQVLVAALALRGPPLVVVTSPEVKLGKKSMALLSHNALKIFRDYVDLVVAPLTPSGPMGPEDIIMNLADVLSGVRARGAKILDVSGGPQLVPIAALRAGFRHLTYAYPTGQKVVFYEFRL